MTLDAYSKTWWNERVEAVTRIVEAVVAEPDERKNKETASSQQDGDIAKLPKSGNPFGNLKLFSLARFNVSDCF